MRKLSLLLLLFLFFGCVEKRSAKVTVHVNNNDEERLFLSKPIADNYCFFHRDTVALTGDSIHSFEIEVEKCALTVVEIAGQRCLLILQPGDDLDITFDVSNPKNDILFSGKNAAGQVYFNAVCRERNLYAYEWNRDYSKAPLDTDPEKMWKNFQDLVDRDYAIFLKLKDQGVIDQTFLDFAKRDAQYYYMTLLSRILLSDYYSAIIEQQGECPNGKLLLNRVFETLPLGNRIPSFMFGAEYIENYLRWKAYEQVEEESLEEKEIFDIKTGYTNAIRYFNDPVLQEYALLSVLLEKGLNNKTFDLSFQTYYNDFVSRFPESPYVNIIKPFSDQVSEFHEKVKQDFTSGVKWVTGYENIDTFSDLLSRFDGRNLFIDFWFSTCGPCRKQFGYNRALKEFLKEQDVDMLYISVDSDETDELWKQCIKYYDLEGNHVRANRKLHSDLDKNYGIRSFPAYMIVNKKGEIVVPKALLPEQGKKLLEQITKALDKTTE